MEIPARLKSRKLWMTIGGVVVALVAAFQDGELTQAELWTAMAPVLAYIGVQGAQDTVKVYRSQQ